MHLIFPAVVQQWATSLGQLIEKAWAWWLATYVKFPLLRPVRYVYYVSYTYGPSYGQMGGYYGTSGNGAMDILCISPIRSSNDVVGVREAIIESGPWSKTPPPTLVITSWKFLHKQVFRQNAWHNTRRHPRVA